MTKKQTLLDPKNCVLVMIDFQGQMAFGVKSIDGQTLVNNAEGLAKAARVFRVPTVITSVAAQSFSGPTFRQLLDVFPEQTPIDRTTMNAWEDARVLDAIRKTGRKKLVIAGLWTEVCVLCPALDALNDGYEVYVVTDASGGVSSEAHERAIQRMVQAGVAPLTWLQFMLELQRDWARQETYEPVLSVAKEHAGTYGLGVQYAKAMLGEGANEGKRK